MIINNISNCDFSDFDAIIVGAGFAGTVIAQQLADLKDYKVLIIEKRNHIAGNMYDGLNDFGVEVHHYGPHLFHTNSDDVYNYLSLFTDWYDYKHKVIGSIGGKFVPIPFNFSSIDILFDNEKATEYKKLLLKSFPDQHKVSINDLLNHSNENICEFGIYVYENVFVNYTSKQWGIHPNDIDKSVLNRVPVVLGYEDGYFQDKYQYMPSKGYLNLFQKMLSSNNISVVLNCDINSIIKIENDFLYLNNHKVSVPFIYTGMIDALCEYKYGTLPYRSLDMVFENYNIENFQQNSVINYPNEHEYTRITEFKYFTPTNTKGKTTVLMEYPKTFRNDENGSEPYYPINNNSNDLLYEKYKNDLCKIPNIFLCGRLAEYKYYNMDGAILNALSIAKIIMI